MTTSNAGRSDKVGVVLRQAFSGQPGQVLVHGSSDPKEYALDTSNPAESEAAARGTLVRIRFDAGGTISELRPVALETATRLIALQSGDMDVDAGRARAFGDNFLGGGRSAPALPAGTYNGQQTYLVPAKELDGKGAVPGDKSKPLDPSLPLLLHVPQALPKWVTDLGYLPDISGWLPGDVILVCETDPSVFAEMIRIAQSSGYETRYGLAHGRWQHAAIYLGNYLVCEADIKTLRVRVRPLYPYVGRYLIRVRRATGLDDAQRQDIVDYVLAATGLRYNWQAMAAMSVSTTKKVVMTAIQDEWAKWRRKVGELLDTMNVRERGFGEAEFQDAYFCSELFAHAYYFATQNWPTEEPEGTEIVPATLSASTKLKDIDIAWGRLDRPAPAA